MKSPMVIRPHHGLCINFFKGKGYSDYFVKKMTELTVELKQNPKKKIILQCKTDIFCSACPHNKGSLCESAEKVLEYDRKCLELCNIPEGEVLTWEQFQKALHENILLPKRLSEICGDCQWSGICEKLIK